MPLAQLPRTTVVALATPRSDTTVLAAKSHCVHCFALSTGIHSHFAVQNTNLAT